MDIDGKTALVTGGTDGIGAEIARQLRAKGAEVIVGGRDPGRVKAARDAGLEAIRADLTSAEGVAALVDALGGRAIDILINNAGMGGSTNDFEPRPHRQGDLPQPQRSDPADRRADDDVALAAASGDRQRHFRPRDRAARGRAGLLRDQGGPAQLHPGAAAQAARERCE